MLRHRVSLGGASVRRESVEERVEMKTDYHEGATPHVVFSPATLDGGKGDKDISDQLDDATAMHLFCWMRGQWITPTGDLDG
jgi:hypothetical protein